MKNTRKMLGAAAVALGGAGLLAACAPPATPVVPPTGPTDTKTIALTCSVYIPVLGTSIPSTNTATLTLTGVDPTPTGTGIDVSIDIDGGIVNGPVATTDGTVEVFTSLDGAPAVEIGSALYGATAAYGVADVPTITGTTDAVSAEATVNLTRITYTANSGSGAASGICDIAPGDQPAILVGVV